MLKETKKEFIQVLKDYRQLVNKKHSDIEAYNQIKSKSRYWIEAYCLNDSTNYRICRYK